MASQPSRRRADAQRNRERLLAAAEAALNADGVNASLDDIAKAAGVGNATLYRHFPTREKLIEAVYDHRIRALCDAAGELAASGEAGEALVDWLRAVVCHITQSQVLGDAFMAAYEGPADVEPPQIIAWHRALREVAAPLLGAAQAAGAVRPDLDVVELLALTTAVARAGNPAQAGHFLGFLLEGIVPRPG
ncbi:TetR/AcrR family transcriptional regulator [Actinoallomurus bryophytorum]|uniref:TetR family transcriptional regulator n=1 Tax=Actinoallomurus bryophytorum TaxID=1490222 RepID=A0A543CH82_9ACTN|nr:TetR/AcrR family transcriptional regulator [Actinoallomurus bryophytorum]TQL96455.1 TetR family transcriptional regulator [Actinoallomurus bryophytorum]